MAACTLPSSSYSTFEDKQLGEFQQIEAAVVAAIEDVADRAFQEFLNTGEALEMLKQLGPQRTPVLERVNTILERLEKKCKAVNLHDRAVELLLKNKATKDLIRSPMIDTIIAIQADHLGRIQNAIRQHEGYFTSRLKSFSDLSMRDQACRSLQMDYSQPQRK